MNAMNLPMLNLLPDQNPMLDLLQRLPVFRGGYDTGVSLVEPLVDFVLQAGYELAGVGRPLPPDLPIAANGVFEDSIVVPDGSWLVGATFGSQREAGFKYNLYDTSSKRSLFQRDAIASCVAGGAGARPQPYYLPQPLPILGNLNLIMTNLDNNAEGNDMQLLLFIAIPVDPTGRTERNHRVIT
jgi:hypothetical protein